MTTVKILTDNNNQIKYLFLHNLTVNRYKFFSWLCRTLMFMHQQNIVLFTRQTNTNANIYIIVFIFLCSAC